jgi:hypothetical protein
MQQKLTLSMNKRHEALKLKIPTQSLADGRNQLLLKCSGVRIYCQAAYMAKTAKPALLLVDS